jgi:DNA-binding LacI/PurR family transcriptional regulator
MTEEDIREFPETLAVRRTGKPRLSDIATAASVSVSTVSRALSGASGISDDLRRQVIEVAGQLGYDKLPNDRREGPAAPIGSVTVLTCTQYITDSSNDFYSAILEGVRGACSERDVGLKSHLLDLNAPDLAGCARVLDSIACEGVLLLGLDEAPFLDVVRRAGVPAVIVSGDDPEMEIDSVSPAFRSGASLATRHLITQGHEQIVHVNAMRRSTCRKRLDGFLDALRDAGIPFHDDMIIDLPSYAADDVEKAMTRRLRETPLNATAVSCVTDSAAMGVIAALRNCGYAVPKDVSVIGFDDMPVSQFFTPSLTTIHVAREDIGRTAVERLLDRVRNPGAPAWRVELGGHLVQRDSVAARADSPAGA